MNRMMQAQEVADEFRARAIEFGLTDSAAIYSFMSGSMAVEILGLRERLAQALRLCEEQNTSWIDAARI